MIFAPKLLNANFFAFGKVIAGKSLKLLRDLVSQLLNKKR
jgi:hypothetical protein